MTGCGSNLTNKSGVAVPPGLPGGKRHNEAANKRRPLINADHPGRIGVLHEAFGLAPKPRGLGAIILQDPKKLEWDFVLSRESESAGGSTAEGSSTKRERAGFVTCSIGRPTRVLG